MGRLLGLNLDLKEQLAFYGAYHSNPLNQLIHFAFVPLILWTVAVWLAYTPPLVALDLAPHLAFLPAAVAEASRFLVFNGSFVLLAAYSLYYLTLEPFAGATWALATALPLWGAANAFRQAVPSAWGWALAAHAAAWFMQIVPGHAWAEGRKPALLDSFVQSLVLAPLFVWLELLFALGYRPALHAEVQARAQRSVAAWRAQAAPLLSEGRPPAT